MSEGAGDGGFDSLVDLIVDHYVRLAFEDLVAKKIRVVREDVRDFLSRVRNNLALASEDYVRLARSLSWIIYGDHVVESVRLGVYRTLFFETHKAVHGELVFLSLTSHGVIKEHLDIIKYIKYAQRLAIEKLHTGIDFAVIFEYPSSKRPDRKIIVPLFVIGKYREKDIREIRLWDAVKTVLSDQSLKNKKIRLALEYVPKFTVVSLLRTITDPEELRQNKDCLLKVKYCRDMPVYFDLACSIVYPVLEKIPEFYNIVDSNEELAELTAYDWLNALIQLAVPLINIVFPSSSSPPSSSSGGLVRGISSKIRSNIINRLSKVRNKIEVEKTKYYTREFKQQIRNRLNVYWKSMRRSKYEKERNKLALHSG